MPGLLSLNDMAAALDGMLTGIDDLNDMLKAVNDVANGTEHIRFQVPRTMMRPGASADQAIRALESLARPQGFSLACFDHLIHFYSKATTFVSGGEDEPYLLHALLARPEGVKPKDFMRRIRKDLLAFKALLDIDGRGVIMAMTIRELSDGAHVCFMHESEYGAWFVREIMKVLMFFPGYVNWMSANEMAYWRGELNPGDNLRKRFELQCGRLWRLGVSTADPLAVEKYQALREKVEYEKLEREKAEKQKAEEEKAKRKKAEKAARQKDADAMDLD